MIYICMVHDDNGELPFEIEVGFMKAFKPDRCKEFLIMCACTTYRFVVLHRPTCTCFYICIFSGSNTEFKSSEPLKTLVMLCYAMLCYVMLCYVMLCYVMLCYVMLCYVNDHSV